MSGSQSDRAGQNVQQPVVDDINPTDSVDHHHSCEVHHDHASHADLDTSDGRRRVAIACGITALFMVVETIGGIVSGSLALIADATHMLTDSASLALAWLGYWFAAKPPDETRTFGFGRMRVLAAFANGIALFFLAAWILIEAVVRLINPQPVAGEIMLWVAIGGLVVNLCAAYVLHGGDTNDINLSGALWHVLGDLMASVAAIVAAVVILATNWTPIDPILSILVALLLLVAGTRITARAGQILLQSAPHHVKPSMVNSKLIENVAGVMQVESLHVWQLTEDKTVVSVCVRADEGVCTETLRVIVAQYLKQELNVSVTTVEVMKGSAVNVGISGGTSANDDHFTNDTKPDDAQ